MTGDHFGTWLRELNYKMAQKNRKILLIIDNSPAHPKDVSLSNVQLEFLPANTTSCTQPLDQGIIKVTKHRYRQRLVQRYINEIDHPELAKPLNVLDALHYITASWQDVSVKTVQNCFKKAGFVKTNVLLTEDDAGLPHFQFEGIEELEARGINLDEYLHVDDNLFTTEAESLNDIIDNCTTKAEINESDDEEEHPSEPPPSKLDAFNFPSCTFFFLNFPLLTLSRL
ncbi:hypothetical protein V9T40_008734 [Parthenolecanium corni]|uniref:DDE-1 domain-containing protein n=1 Tax=Parthenolecanium corni TaxID=536013 RepID=A0AAN9Y673_9HEMI